MLHASLSSFTFVTKPMHMDAFVPTTLPCTWMRSFQPRYQVQQQARSCMGCRGRARPSPAGATRALLVLTLPPLIKSREQGIKILECTQTSGDILYVPSMYVLSIPLSFVSHVARKVGAFGVVPQQHHRHRQVVFILIMQLRSTCSKSSSCACNYLFSFAAIIEAILMHFTLSFSKTETQRPLHRLDTAAAVNMHHTQKTNQQAHYQHLLTLHSTRYIPIFL
jgi:hypothetical protein